MHRIRKPNVKTLDKQIVSQNLKAIRMQKGFTQLDVAVKLDMSQNGYSKIELARTQLTLEMLCEMSDLFDMGVEDLTASIVDGAEMKHAV